MVFNWILLIHEFVVVGLAFIFHEIGHVWMAKRRGVFEKMTVWKLFKKIPLGVLVHTNKKKGTIEDQIDIASVGIFTGIPFLLLSWQFAQSFAVYMFASFLDVLNVTILTLLILKGVPKTMTLEKVVKKYDINISWRGIKVEKVKK